jgi:hypothetical protein
LRVDGFEEHFENKEEDDDFRLEVYDPWSREKIEVAKGDEDSDEGYDVFHRCLS